MTAVRVGFVGGDSWLDRAIEGISGSQYADISHAYIHLLSSIVTATKFLTGHNIFAGGENTMHCSETVTRILRAGGLQVCPGLQADEVSPVLLYEDLMRYHSGVLA